MLVIWGDWKGELHAFCSCECQRHYTAWVADPSYIQPETATKASFGCLWCGGDLTEGAEWLSSRGWRTSPRLFPGQRR